MKAMVLRGPNTPFELTTVPDPVAGPGEAVVELSGIKLFLNAESRLLLDGVTIDFTDTAAQTGLIFKDPKQVCCSSSAGKTTH